MSSSIPSRKKYREIWCKGTPGADARLLTRMIGERITDGETEATLSWLLTAEDKPALFIGKSFPEIPSTVVSEFSDAVFDTSAWGAENDYDVNQLAGKIVYLPEFLKESSSLSSAEVIEARDYFGIRVTDKTSGEITILDNESDVLPPSLYDISTLTPIMSDPNGNSTLTGTYIYEKRKISTFLQKSVCNW